MSKKGLGTGLGALFGDAAVDTGARDFEYLPLQRIEPKSDQPRTLFDEERISELADSIREHGVLSPLLVRSVEGGYYQIIAGERRWRAAREAGISQVPARIVIADDKTALELAMVENLQREDLSPIEEARGYKALMDEFEMTQDEVAQRVSKSRPAVANSLRLLSLPDDMIELVLRKELSAGSARALLALKSDDNIREAAKLVIGNDMSVREVEALVRKQSREKPDKTKKHIMEVNYIKEAQNRLTASMGRRVTIKQGKGKGKVELEYYDQEDFDALFDMLLEID
ncbi:MAG: ParB/RepB/Spo0J family partition protein [Oscillospiraceae bacterium]|jgi:ParB family chromosome partitioning protein|nr:ParB/RepB/Spo0J family partition protein [Oscillospiraceae bacterium]